MSEDSSRRDFLKGLFGEASKRAPRLLPAAPVLGLADPPAPGGPLRARSPGLSRTASLEELRTLALKVGLMSKLEGLESLACQSLRLIVAPRPRGAPRVVRSGVQPGRGRESSSREPLLRLSLGSGLGDVASKASALAGSLTLELDGTTCHVTLLGPNRAAGSTPATSPSHTPGGWADTRGGSSQLPIAGSIELVLPRTWSDRVQELGLTDEETRQWTQLRKHLAAFQGADLPGEQEPPPVIHRLLGYPDERNGDMPLACELAIGDPTHVGPAYSHPRAPEFASAANRWRLLLQLSADELLGWSWGSGDERLYVWIDEADLAMGDLSRTHTIIQ